MSEKFYVGGRVVLLADGNGYDGNPAMVEGITGTVCSTGSRCGVRWDLEFQKGHTCNGKCENGFGWYVPYEYLELETVDNTLFENVEAELESILGV